MSEIFREIDEEVRRDKALKLWRSYGKYVVTAILAVVIGVAGGEGWKKYRHGQRTEQGARYDETMRLLARDQAAVAAQQFALLAVDAGAGYAALARFREAEALALAGDDTGAVAALDRLAADSSADQALRDLAALFAALRLMDDASVEEIEGRLEPLLREGSPWRASAREMTAVVALRGGQQGRAVAIYTALAEDASTPPTIRARAREMLAALGAGQGGS